MKPVAIVTGGSDGVGAAIVEKLSNDYTVVCFSRHESKSGEWMMCDVTSSESIKHAVNSVIEKHGSIDVLINNAGVWLQGPLDESSNTDIDSVLRINTEGTILMTSAVIPHMKQKKQGTIVNIISLAGLYTKPGRSVYTASKFAITGFTKSLQPELATFNIRVLGIYPGKINTKLFQKAGNTKDMDDALTPNEVAESVQWMISQPQNVVVQALEIKHIKH